MAPRLNDPSGIYAARFEAPCDLIMGLRLYRILIIGSKLDRSCMAACLEGMSFNRIVH